MRTRLPTLSLFIASIEPFLNGSLQNGINSQARSALSDEHNQAAKEHKAGDA
jgi:hypothetical protein